MVSGARKEKSVAVTLTTGGSVAGAEERAGRSEQAATGTRSSAAQANVVGSEIMAVEATKLRVRVRVNYVPA
jgi:hypothetical protein